MVALVFSITTAGGNTITKTSPQRTRRSIPSGIITKVDIEIPSGVAALSGVQIYAGGQLWYPQDASEWITGDGETVSFLDNRDIRKGSTTPKDLTILSYNEDEEHTHTITVRFSIIT